MNRSMLSMARGAARPGPGRPGRAQGSAATVATAAATCAAAIASTIAAAAVAAAGVPEPCAGGALGGAAIVEAVNALRAQGADCGEGGRFAAAPPLRWDPRLAAAADRHAQELVQRDVLDHLDREGRDGGHRIRAEGYRALRWAENLGAGPPTLAQMLAAWAASAKHCANLMHPGLADVGLACRGPDGPRRTWVMTLARAADR